MRRPLSEQIREVPQSFGWIDRNLIHLGFLEEMTRHEFLLYAFLCLTSDRYGMSFWGVNKTAKLLKISHNSLEKARRGLKAMGLIEYEKDEVTGRISYQVLPLPVDRVELVRRRKRAGEEGQSKPKQSPLKAKRKPRRVREVKGARAAERERNTEDEALEVRRQIRRLLQLDEVSYED